MSILKAEKIRQFSNENHSEYYLDNNVLSDHPKRYFSINKKIYRNNYKKNYKFNLSFLNISSPYFVKYFNNCDVKKNNEVNDNIFSPFLNTHLYVYPDVVDNIINSEILIQKEKQLSIICDEFINGTIPIQIILEGYSGFYKRIEEILSSRNKHDFAILKIDTNKKINKSQIGILIDLGKFRVLKTYNLFRNYYEVGKKIKCRLISPCVKIQHIASRAVIQLVPIHISGNNQQFPVNGLQVLKEYLLSIPYFDDIICCGDFNTEEYNLQSEIVDKIPNCKLISWPNNIKTHVNPYLQKVNYDNIIHIKKSSNINVENLPLENHDISTLKLIESINRCSY